MDADAARQATVAALREKIARLGGLGGAAPRPRTPVQLQPAVPHQPGFEPQRTQSGTTWLRRVDVDMSPFLDAARVSRLPDADELHALTRVEGRAGGNIAVLDIESLGLRGSGVLAFLIGVGVQRGPRHLDVHQFLLCDPSAEASQLRAVLDLVDGCAALITYNGRTFDVPALRARCIVNRLSSDALDTAPHCDLLGPVRRLFRDRLGACNLRQAEVELLGMERIDDVPGMEAPGRYRAWLRGADPDVLEGVIRHNHLDLCATAVLGARLTTHVAGDMVQPVHAADRYRLALHLERHAEHQRAERLLRDAVAARVAPWDRRAAHRLALRLRRSGAASGEAEALTLLRALWRGDPSDLRGARALAVALERAGHLDEALDVSARTLRLCRSMPAWRHRALRGAPQGGWCADWERRADRLEQRVARSATTRRRAAVQPKLSLAGA
jgi:uncharacterized protein YprB with RNaseH-like and TPR domain